MKTYSLKKEEVERSWFVLDVTDRILGRVATKIADRIRGKDKPTFTPHTDGAPRILTAAKKPSSGFKSFQFVISLPLLLCQSRLCICCFLTHDNSLP